MLDSQSFYTAETLLVRKFLFLALDGRTVLLGRTVKTMVLAAEDLFPGHPSPRRYRGQVPRGTAAVGVYIFTTTFTVKCTISKKRLTPTVGIYIFTTVFTLNCTITKALLLTPCYLRSIAANYQSTYLLIRDAKFMTDCTSSLSDPSSR